MDSLTQAVLGGAVGHAVAGRTLGRRAAAWGALAGTLPDLDVVTYPFLDTAGQLLVHRGVTHGIAFGLVVGPLLGWLGWRLARWRATSRSESPSRAAPQAWRAWVALWTLGLITHPLLDVFTVYGTQLLAPFSKHPFAIGSVFIIDPLYTVPLLVFLVVALVRKRPRWAAIGLAVSTGYLGWSVGAQQVVRARAEADLPPADRVLVTPFPLQTLVWRVEAERDGRVASYRHAVLDPGYFEADLEDVPLVSFPLGLEGTRGVETLEWFSRGWLVRPRGRDTNVVADARFGRGPSGDYVFQWRVAEDGSFRQLPFEARLGDGFFRDLAGDMISLR